MKRPFVPRELSADTKMLAGTEYVRKAQAAALRLSSISPEALAAFGEGQEVAGGEDFEPSDA